MISRGALWRLSGWKAYALTVAAVLLATAVQALLGPAFGSAFTFVPFYFAVMLSAAIGGLIPALVAMVLGYAIFSVGFLSPGSLIIHGTSELTGLAIYLFLSVSTGLLTESLHNARRRIDVIRERLRVTLLSIADAVITTDARGQVDFMNPAAEALTRWDAEQAVHLPISTIFLTADERTRVALENPAVTALKTGAIVSVRGDAVLLAKDGSQRSVDNSAAPIRDAAGRVVGSVLVFRDVTELRRAEAASARLAEIVTSSDDGIISKDLNGRITSWNHGAEKIFGYSASEAVGQGITLIAPAERKEEMRSILERITRGERIDHFETIRRRKDGSQINVSLTISPIYNAQREIVGASKIVRDVTHIKRAQEEREMLLAAERAARAEAEAANRLKDEFLANVSHEIRTPLNAILGWAQLLGGGHVGEEDFEQGLEVIERNARVQAQLIDDLLDMNRITSGKIRLDIQRIDLATIIQSVLETVRPAAVARQIAMESRIEPVRGAMMGDAARVQQIIWNLLSNAIKFTPQQGKVEICLTSGGMHAEIVVSDSGQGIETEFLPYIFERFQQADGSSTREVGGLGLGLAIVKQLVELHGGTVEAASGGKGLGATFTVRLPLRPAPDENRRGESGLIGLPEPCGDMPMLDGITVLVVDDEADTRDFMHRVLAGRDARVLMAKSAAEALTVLSHERPDILLSDIGMPEQDGYSLIRQVRALTPEQGGDIPAAALTAFTRSEDRKRALLAGFQSHVAKPITPTELVAIVAGLARHRSK
jgi:PAS domain S-box-containing protein